MGNTWSREQLDGIRETWTPWLEDFTRDVYPIFHRFGFSLDGALTNFQLNEILNEIKRLGSDDDGESWKRGAGG